MNKDTPKAIEEIYINKLKQKTDIERALMGFSMFETARLLVKSSLIIDASDSTDLKIAIFNRFYANDFNEETRKEILQHLKNN